MAARMNVYVPDDLKRRMGRVKDVSWSQVACDAFEQKLGERAAQKKEKKMEDVVQRLRASKMASDSDTRKAGREAGREWAANEAAAEELQRLQACFDREQHHDRVFIVPDGNAFCGAECLVFVIRPELGNDRQDAADFWESALGDQDTPTDEFVQGFAEGALQLWAEVEAQL